MMQTTNTRNNMFHQRLQRFDRIFNSLLRTLMLIFFGLANVNNGLTSYVAKEHLNDELHRNINQNLIMSPSSVSSASSGATATSSSALLSSSDGGSIINGVFHHPTHFAGTSSASSSSSSSSAASTSSMSTSSFLASSSSISASSSVYHQTSGSSIKSFDSANVLTQQQEQQQQQHQQQSHGRQLATMQQHYQPTNLQKHHQPLHKVVGVGGSASSGLNENLLIDTNTSAEGAEGGDLYAAPMYFGTENSTVVTTQIGATAHIPCTIHHIGDGVVSWIRKKDYHLLTVGLTTYSSDERFSATHLKHSEDWTLQIKFVQLRDAGVYECQVSTHPPTSIFLHLNVVEARAEISGPPIRYLTPGSTLRLQCRVVQNTEASEFIFWYHDNRMINYDIDRGINVSTEPDFQSSELTILRTRREHSGNFTCVASNTQPASVLVHIFKGDNPAAMYHGHVGSSTKSYQTHLPSIMLIVSTGYRIFCSHIRIKIV